MIAAAAPRGGSLRVGDELTGPEPALGVRNAARGAQSAMVSDGIATSWS